MNKYCEQMLPEWAPIEKNLQQEHFKNKLLMHAKFRKENRCTQQEYHTRETTTTRKDVQLQIET